jgi:polar amino acid transport system substrate-binding protein
VTRARQLWALAALCSVAAAFVLGVAACGGPKPATLLERFSHILGHEPTGMAKTIASTGRMTVADDGNYPPQSWIEKGKLQGFDVDVANKVAELLGVQVTFTNPTWDAVPAGLRARAFDVSIGSLAPTNDLKAIIAFTDPYYYTGGQLAVRQGTAPITSTAALAGKTVGVGAQTVFFYWLRSHTKAVVKTYPSEADAFPALKDGSLDAVMCSLPTIEQAIKSGEPFALSGTPLFYQPLAFAVRKGQPDMVALLNYCIRTMRSDGTLARLSREWFNGLDLTVAAK